MTAVLAVDFGATSVRVCRVELGDGPPELEVVYRRPHQPVRDADGHFRWDWSALVGAMEEGLRAGVDRGPVWSIGVDTWAVDYGLLDGNGNLIAPPFSYRDHRTDGFRDVVELIGERHLYEVTGLQLQPFNTLFQVAAHRRDELDRARHLLFLPELLVHHLTGVIVAERTSAGSSALVDAATGAWSTELCASAGIDPTVLPEILPATTCAGSWHGIPVHLVGGHDTASAVAAMGAAPGPGTAFVASGTWLLVGREQDEPDTSEAAQRANFTNEAAVLGGYRHLRNIAGFWLLEQCRPAWGDASIAELVAEAALEPAGLPVVDATSEPFLHPVDMLAEVRAAAGLDVTTPRGVIVRCIIDSLAVAASKVIDQLGGVTDVRVFGGGVRIDLFLERLAAVSGLPIHAGPVEAAALGNAMVQGIALGVYQDLADARAALEPMMLA